MQSKDKSFSIIHNTNNLSCAVHRLLDCTVQTGHDHPCGKQESFKNDSRDQKERKKIFFLTSKP